jgi:hypothetical protein
MRLFHILYLSWLKCRFHPTAERNAISFSLISEIFSPEILLHALDE